MANRPHALKRTSYNIINPMKKNRLTFYTKYTQGLRIDSLKEAAQTLGIDFHVANYDSIEEVQKNLQEFGEVVMNTTRPLNKIDRTIVTELLQKNGNRIINNHHYTHPLYGNKYFQQSYLKTYNVCPTIPSAYCQKEEELDNVLIQKNITFPCIAKKTVGSEGKHVYIVQSKEELLALPYDISELVMQPFIQNDGDYRVYIVNGKSLGVMKRIDKEGDFRNNISQGGEGIHITDPTEKNAVEDIALKVAKAMQYEIVGVDIIHDKQDNIYRFLETNSQAYWGAYHEIINVDVAMHIMKYAKQLMN